MKRFDVIVAGGGPAGCATALALAQRGHSCLLVERSRYDAFRVGETLPPRANPLLVELGLWSRFIADGHLPSQSTASSWGSDELRENHFIFNRHGPGWHLDRRRFDAMFAQAARIAGVEIRIAAAIHSLGRDAESWRVEVECNCRRDSLSANFLVDASGASACVARHLGEIWRAHDRMIALLGILTPRIGHGCAEKQLLLEAVENGWWYSVPLPDGTLLAALMTDREFLSGNRQRPEKFWRCELARSRHTARRASNFQIGKSVHVRIASAGRLTKCAGAGWLAVGDAACAFDPLSGQGLAKALAHALDAAHEISASLRGEALSFAGYEAALATSFDRHIATRARFYALERRWLNSLFWRVRTRQVSPAESPKNC